MPFTRLRQSMIKPNGSITGSLSGTSSYSRRTLTASYALNSSGGGGGGSVQTGSIAKQTVWTNVTSGSTNTITSLNLSSNKWDVSVVEEWDAAILDQYYNSCSLLCHFDSLNPAGRFIDNSRNKLNLTSSGNVSLSTAQYEFGGNSGYFNGGWLTLPFQNSFTFGTSDFTVEFWIYPTNLGANLANQQIFFTAQGSNGLGISFFNNTVHISQYGVADLYDFTSAQIANNIWAYVAVSRNGTNFRCFVNGVQAGITQTNSTNFAGSSTSYIGAGVGILPFYGYADELRITKGVARYTSNFTPSSTPFPNSRNQVLTKYVGLVGGIDDKYVDYGVEKLSNSSLKLTRLTYPNQPLIGSGSLSGSVSRVYVNVLDYTNVSVTSSYSRRALTASYLLPASNNTTKAIFGYGYTSAAVSITNLVSNTGVVANDTTGVGTARYLLAAAGYGTDKAIFGYGYNDSINLSITNLVSNTGVVANDTTGVGTARNNLAAAGYGTDKAIFGYGYTSANVSMTNLVSNTGVVATDTTGIGTARNALAAAGYGGDKAIFGYGTTGAVVSMTNLVSNTGVVATDTTGIGTARNALAATGYGTDKAIFGYGTTGTNVSMTNLVSNTGVVATDTTGVGTARYHLKSAGYGGDKAIFGYGYTGTNVSMINLVSNTGVVANDTTGIGTARWGLSAAGYSTT